MAKKVVATLQTSTKKLTKVIKMVKSPKTGAYTFVEKVMPGDDVDAWLKSKYSFHAKAYCDTTQAAYFCKRLFVVFL